jgi:hypothetical protein
LVKDSLRNVDAARLLHRASVTQYRLTEHRARQI